MYPSVDINEAIQNLADLYAKHEGPTKLPLTELIEALELCQKCNCVEYMNKFYVANKGIAMGPPHACDLTDIWIGPIAKKCNEECKIESIGFSIYRDDGSDVLING